MASTSAPPNPTSSLDPAEAAKFAKLASQWWNVSGPFGALHRMNPVRLAYVRAVVRREFSRTSVRFMEGLDVLDVGCGGGLVAEPLARLGANVLAIDAAEDAIAAAKAHAALAGLTIDYQSNVVEALPDAPLFDVITAMDVVEHVADPLAFVAESARRLKPGGVIVISTINRTQKARALAIFGAEKVLRWAPSGAHDYDKLVRPDELMSVSGLDWAQPTGVSYNPLGTGWAQSNDTSMNYMIHAKRPAEQSAVS